MTEIVGRKLREELHLVEKQRDLENKQNQERIKKAQIDREEFRKKIPLRFP